MDQANSANNLRLSPQVRHRCVGDEGVLVNLATARVVVVNRVGLAIVEQLAKPIGVDALSDFVAAKFDISNARAKQDTLAYIDALKAEQLVLDA